MSTPKNLRQAIQNGNPDAMPTVVWAIEANVRDFLAQKFSIAMIEHGDDGEILKELFDLCTRRDDEGGTSNGP